MSLPIVNYYTVSDWHKKPAFFALLLSISAIVSISVCTIGPMVVVPLIALLILYLLLTRPGLCLLCLLFLLPLAPPEFKYDVGLSLTVDRVLLACYLLSILLVKSSTLLNYPFEKQRLWLFFLLFTLLNMYHLLSSENPLETSFENIYLHFFSYIILFSSQIWHEKPDTSGKIDHTLLISGILIALMGMYETVNHHYLFAYEVEHLRGAFLRAKATLGNPIPYGVYLSLLFPLAYVRLFSRSHWLYRMGMAGVAVVLMGGIIVSFSRQAILSLMISLIAPLVYWLFKVRKLRQTAIVTAIILLILGLLGTLLLHAQMNRIFFSGDALDNVKSRLHMSMVALAMFYEHPLSGIGLGNFRYHAYDYSFFRLTKMPVSLFGEAPIVDNSYLTLLAETGLTGLLLLFALLWVILKEVWWKLEQQGRKQITSYFCTDTAIPAMVILIYLFNGFMVDVFEYPSLTLLFWLMVGRIFARPGETLLKGGSNYDSFSGKNSARRKQ